MKLKSKSAIIVNGGEGKESSRKTSNKLIEWTVRLERIKHPPISAKQHLPNPLVYMLLRRGAYTGTTYRELISAIGALKCARQFVPPLTLETQYTLLSDRTLTITALFGRG